MRTAKISELKAKLSAHIKFVESGEEVLIMNRDKAVARLVPPAPQDDQDARRSRLIAKGILRPAKRVRIEGEEWQLPSGPMISREVMERIWREEREGR